MSTQPAFPFISEDKRASFVAARPVVRNALRAGLPMKVFGQLLDSGWPRNWAEELVRDVEIRDNPSGKLPGREAHRMAAGAQVSMILGGFLFAAGSIVTGITLFGAMVSPGGGLVIIAYGSILGGIVMFVQGFKESRKFPRRPLPGGNVFEESGTIRPNRNPADPY